MSNDEAGAVHEQRPRGPAWSAADAAELYQVERWSEGYFSVRDDGALLVHPVRGGDGAQPVDLPALIDELHERGIALPVLLRFSGILRDRIEAIHAAFEAAIREEEYGGRYASIYPIKVNQQRQVVEEVQRFGRRFGNGLEAGSKPELLALLAIADEQTPIVCNGFKDDEYIETVLLAQKIGRDITPVIERYGELDLVLRYAAAHEVRPRIGVRLKLATRGSGRWQQSAGSGSKFGLTTSEALELFERLAGDDLGDCLKLLHFHVGSQITDIRRIKLAVTEAARVYAELLRLGAGLEILDVGGGLGVDYDGTQSSGESSINYSLEEYASDVVYHIASVCRECDLPHPTIYAECGRAITAFHSVLVVETLEVKSAAGRSRGAGAGTGDRVAAEPPQPLRTLEETLSDLATRDPAASLHDAQQSLVEALELFRLGYLSLPQRARAEQLYGAICSRLVAGRDEEEQPNEELFALERELSDIYFCNFSVFQSIPDSWAIRQLFPIMPIHRLAEEPTRRAVLADVSCDSDGRIDRFIDLAEPRPTLLLHPVADDAPYRIGIFLVGAYQEILGDLHNLFGDTNAVHVGIDEDGAPAIEDVVEGDSVREVLAYVQYDADILRRRFRKQVERAVRGGRLTPRESGQLLRFYEQGLQGYTYLE